MVDDDISFTYEADTEVEMSCAATFKDEMWVLGGSSQKRQVIFGKFFNDNLLNKNSLDEQSSRMQIGSSWRITFRLLCWWM